MRTMIGWVIGFEGASKAGHSPEVNQLELAHLPHAFDERLGSLHVRTNQRQLAEPRETLKRLNVGDKIEIEVDCADVWN